MNGAAVEVNDLAVGVNGWLREVVLLLRRATAEGGASGPQLAVLGSLEHGRRRMSELAAEHGVRLPTMTAMVNRMERDGLVERRRDDADARVITVGLTAAGDASLRETRQLRVRFIRERLALLSEEDRDTIAAALPILSKLSKGE